ncbi:MAG: PAS domain S-box protein, partial [Deltaproteobacteria bacterium]|nr:PAS domain S-box protein [Deltaproteobacteria bacterium]
MSSPIFELLSLPSWVFEIDTQRVIAVNAAACEFYGYTRDEFLALQLKDLRPPAEEQKLVEDIARVRSAGVLRGQWLHKNKAGEVIEVEVMGRPLTLDGVPCRWVTVLDRRETARLTEAKEQAEQLVRLVLDNAGMIVFVIDDKGIMRLNEGEALRAMGLAPGYLVGEQVLDHRMGLQFRTPLGLVDGAEVTRRVMAGEVFTGLLEHNGRVVENVIAPLRGQDGKVRGQTGFARDVTNQVRQSERLMQAHKLEAIGRLAGGIAHDFNNMLTIIASATENLMDRIPEGTDERVELQDIHDATVRSSLLTRQLLAFSRRQPIVPRLVDINMLLGDAGRMLERLVGEDVQLEIKL